MYLKALTTEKAGKIIHGDKFDSDEHGKSVRGQIRSSQASLRSQGYMAVKFVQGNSKIYYSCKPEDYPQLKKLADSLPISGIETKPPKSL